MRIPDIRQSSLGPLANIRFLFTQACAQTVFQKDVTLPANLPAARLASVIIHPHDIPSHPCRHVSGTPLSDKAFYRKACGKFYSCQCWLSEFRSKV